MTVREASPADIPEIITIERASFSDPWTADGFIAEFDDPMSIFLAAHNDSGRVTGYIVGSCDGYSAYISNIAVSHEARRTGTGTQLLEEFKNALPETAESITLDVRVSNLPAIELYTKFGFKAAGIRKSFYTHPAENAAVMIMNIGR